MASTRTRIKPAPVKPDVMCFKKCIHSLIAAALFAGNVYANCGDRASLEDVRESNKETVSGPFSVAELERDRMIEIRHTGEVLPFGYSNQEWEKLKSLMEAGDEIFYVEHQDGMYRHSGHLLVREGCVVYFLLGFIT